MSIYLVDYENVKNDGLYGIDTLTKEDLVYVFYSKNVNTITIDTYQKLLDSEAKVKFIETILPKRNSKNYLDFQLATFCGYLVAEDNKKKYYIVTGDNGFNAIIDFFNNNSFFKNLRVEKISKIQAVKRTEKTSLKKETPNKDPKPIKKDDIVITKEEPVILKEKSEDVLLVDNKQNVSPKEVENKEKKLSNSKNKKIFPKKLKPIIVKEENKTVVDFRNSKATKAKQTITKLTTENKKELKPYCRKLNFVPANYAALYRIIQTSKDKQEFYVALVKSFGQDRGKQIYDVTKPVFLKIIKGE